MRTLLILTFALILTLPVRAQTDEADLVEINCEINAAEGTVERAALAVAEAREYLREEHRVGNPTLLVAGDMYLRISGAPFVLHLSSTDHHTAARLESQKREVSEQAVGEAKVFLEEVTDRATAK